MGARRCHVPNDYGRDLSGKKTVKLSTSFDARAEFASNFDVAKFNKLIVGSFALPGTDVTFAGLQIEVQPGATIDTSLSAGSSGNLKFECAAVFDRSGDANRY